MRPIDLIVVHHSASSLLTTANEIRNWHRERGFSDIGYHRVIEGDGSVVDGRPVQQVGAHARGVNRHSIGICVVGDNTKDGRRWSPEQEWALALTLSYYGRLYPEAEFAGHNQVGHTECPGLDFPEWCRRAGLVLRLMEH